MTMPVMYVRGMSMLMLNFLMRVLMAVFTPGHIFVGMRMVTVVMAVPVVMCNHFMEVGMPVSFRNSKIRSRNHYCQAYEKQEELGILSLL